LSNGPSGVCVWLTGLSGAGKTTTALALEERLVRVGVHVTLLDGDRVRAADKQPLGFTKSDRDLQVRRVAMLARGVVDRGEIALCALVSPYAAARQEARQLIGSNRFVEVLVDTPLSVCEQRDPKGLYARARRGEIVNLTGVDDTYEPPSAPELVITTVNHSATDNALRLVRYLIGTGFLPADHLGYA